MFKRFKRLFQSETALKEELKQELLKEIKPELGEFKPIGTTETIDNWRKQVNLLEDHPLSQARVVNHNILQSLNDVLGSVDTKLGHLEKLDHIIELLKQDQTVVKTSEKAVKTPEKADTAVKMALQKVEYLTLKDRQFLEAVEGKEPISAEEMADYLGCSRSTASFRLNRLGNMGILKKEVQGKKILFKINFE